MDIKSTLSSAVKQLKKTKIKSANLEAEILLSSVLKKSREFILAHPEYGLNKQQVQKLQMLTKKRLDNYPLAYLVGYKEFFGLQFLVNKHVLIPRPETELILEEALIIVANQNIDNIIDIGTGSGCIIITLAKLLKHHKINFYGLDISAPALKVAQRNAKLHQVNVKFRRGNLLQPLIPSKNFNKQTNLLIANLPYLTPRQIANSPSVSREPKLALAAESDGLKYYRQLLWQLVKSSFNFQYLLLEIDPSQKNTIKRLIKNYLPNASWQIKKDLKGHNRLVMIKK